MPSRIVFVSLKINQINQKQVEQSNWKEIGRYVKWSAGHRWKWNAVLPLSRLKNIEDIEQLQQLLEDEPKRIKILVGECNEQGYKLFENQIIDK